MSELAQKTASMLDMLPAKEQQLAYEMLKRIVLAWDPDFTKVTPAEAAAKTAAGRRSFAASCAAKNSSHHSPASARARLNAAKRARLHSDTGSEWRNP